MTGDQAVVDLEGVRLRISTAVCPDVQVGDYVLVHAGFAIAVVDEREAKQSLALFAELARHED